MVQRVYQNTSTPRDYVVRVGEVSKKPSNGFWRQNNPYTFTRCRAPGRNDGSTPSLLAYECIPIGVPVSATNRLYEKVREAIQGPSGELLTSALEWRSSLDMITKRAITLRKAYMAARRLDLPEVAKILSLGKNQRKLVEGRIRKLRIHENPTAIWLEYWMGWAPLMGDIGHSVETLTAPPPLNQTFSVGLAYTVDPRWAEPWGGNSSSSSYQRDYVQQQGRLAAYGKFRITNHNLRLAEQLGFVNPVLTAWQMVPFSFIADWFANVGQVLGSMTDFVGVELIDTGVAAKRELSFSRSGRRRVSSMEPPFYRELYFAREGKGESLTRAPGAIPRPRLVVGLPKLSLTRAATSVSLLTEIFLVKKN